jgi:uncharacterized cofD-like protein
MTRVVGIGGGHGLAVTLRAAQQYADDVTAIVSVADDGGSSGRLRASTGLPAMGDLRVCLTALAAPDDSWARALEHRFHGGELDGHALGNLVLTALAEELGDLSAAVVAVASQLGLRATILLATDVAVTLVAESDAGPVVGQVAVHAANGIKRVALEPEDPPAGAGVVAAIEAADQIVIGPGSLYTSVLAALQEHDVPIDVVLCHPGAMPLGDVDASISGARVVELPVARGSSSVHDPELLGSALANIGPR